MEYEDNARLVNFATGMLCGAVIGASVALLFAPESGRRTRRRISKTAEGVRNSAGDRWDDFTEDVKDRVDEAVQGARKRFS